MIPACCVSIPPTATKHTRFTPSLVRSVVSRVDSVAGKVESGGDSYIYPKDHRASPRYPTRCRYVREYNERSHIHISTNMYLHYRTEWYLLPGGYSYEQNRPLKIALEHGQSTLTDEPLLERALSDHLPRFPWPRDDRDPGWWGYDAVPCAKQNKPVVV